MKKKTLISLFIFVLILIVLIITSLFLYNSSEKNVPRLSYPTEIPLTSLSIEEIMFDAINLDCEDISAVFSNVNSYIYYDGFDYCLKKIKKNHHYTDRFIESIEYEKRYTDNYLYVDFHFTFNEDEMQVFNETPISSVEELYNVFCENIEKENYLYFINIDREIYDEINTSIVLNTAIQNNLFWQEPSYSYVSLLNEKIAMVEIRFNVNYEFLSIHKKLLYKFANDFIESDEFKALDSQEEQIKAINKLVVDTLEYDYIMQENINTFKMDGLMRTKNSAYGGLILKKTTCQGYAQAIKLLCDLANIECTTVMGTLNGDSHIWNKVLIDGKEYYLDATVSDTSSLYDEENILFIGDSYLENEYKIGKRAYIPNLQ